MPCLRCFAVGYVTVLALSVCSATVSSAFAQQTRAEEYANAQQKKADAPVATVNTRGERIAAQIERVGQPPQGFFPFIGTIYPGSWLAIGPGYRRPFNNGSVVLAKAAWSVFNFKSADVQIHSPRFANDRLRLQADAGWLDAPGLEYYGRGNETPRSDRVRFNLRPSAANAALVFSPGRLVRIDAGWGVEKYAARPRNDAPLSRVDLTMGTSTIAATLDWRKSPGWANSGGAVRLMWKGRRGLAGDEISYHEYEGEAIQLIPIMRGNWVVALRGLGTGTDTDGEEIPFFLLPTIGGSTARGFANFRFRDRHRLTTSAELRWAASQFLDLAVFVDAARVAGTRRQLDFNNLHASYGFGARFHTSFSTVIRAEVARGNEGLRFTLGGGPVF